MYAGNFFLCMFVRKLSPCMSSVGTMKFQLLAACSIVGRCCAKELLCTCVFALCTCGVA